jgi:hypothetical protein
MAVLNKMNVMGFIIRARAYTGKVLASQRVSIGLVAKSYLVLYFSCPCWHDYISLLKKGSSGWQPRISIILTLLLILYSL